MRKLRVAALALLVVSSGGCTEIENAAARVPFLAFLHSSPSIDPYEQTRPAPEGSVPSSSPFGVAPYATGNTQADLMDLAGRATNPFAANDTAALAHGRVMFERHCAVCHGPQGRGDGTILTTADNPGRFPFAPPLTSALVQGYSDGYVYAVVRQGRGLMPAYGPRMTEAERWMVVNYVRSLASAGAAPAATQPAAAATTAPAGAATQE